MYRPDTSERHTESRAIGTRRCGGHGQPAFWRSRACRPRPAARDPHARLRAAQAAQPCSARSARFSYGSLYPCLKELLAQGMIAEEEAAPADPDAADRPPVQIVYKITAEGKERLQDLLAQAGPAAWDDDGFGVHFAFFGQTRADIRLRILEGRRRRVEERLEGVRAGLARTRERLDRYTLELQRHGLESVEREVRWLNELIASERQSDAGPGSPQRAIEMTAGRARLADPPAAPSGTVDKEHNRMGSVRVAIVGVGNCAASLVQGVEYYSNADPNDRVPGLMHVQLRRLPRVRRGVRRRLRRGRQEGRPRPGRGDRRQREQHHQDLRRAADRGHRAARADLRRPRASTTGR